VDIKRILTVATMVCLAIVLVGCGSDSKSSSSSTTTTTPKEAVCADKASLEKSVQSLTNSETISGGKNSIEAALKTVQKNLDALKGSAKAGLKPKVDDVKSSLDQLQTVVGNFDSGSITDNLSKAGKAVSKVTTSTSALFTALDTSCP
jgi:ABC-type Fe3+-hydroxamate transport system substrate-binding protein